MTNDCPTFPGHPEGAPEPPVGIVVVAWNHIDDTLECLASIDALNYDAKRVYLVDNGSADDTPAIVRKRFTRVTLVESKRNLGVAAGYNLGIRMALDQGAEYVLILNNDTTVAPDLLNDLVNAATSYPQAGVFMPKVLQYDRPNLLWSSGARYRRFPPAIVFIGMNQPDDTQLDRPQPIRFAPACGLLIRRRVFEAVGLLDPRYFFFYEDWDYCERVCARGITILLVPTARMWHKISRTTRQASETYWRVWGASSARFYRQYGGPSILSLCVHISYLMVREFLQGNGRFLPIFLGGVRAGLLDPYRECADR